MTGGPALKCDPESGTVDCMLGVNVVATKPGGRAFEDSCIGGPLTTTVGSVTIPGVKLPGYFCESGELKI